MKKRLLDGPGDIEWYGEPVIEFVQEEDFEVDGIVYRYPKFLRDEATGECNRSVTPNYMFDYYPG